MRKSGSDSSGSSSGGDFGDSSTGDDSDDDSGAENKALSGGWVFIIRCAPNTPGAR